MGLLSNAISGLQTSQTALRTSGHNISNANTPGYSRQEVNNATRGGQYTGAGFIGDGVKVDSIERVVNQFLSNQLRSDTTSFHDLKTFDDQIKNIDSLLADSGTGLSKSLQSFFASLHAGADDPAAIPSRQLILAEAESLSSRFNMLNGRLEEVGDALATASRATVKDINSLAKSIANLNQAIQEQMAKSQGKSPNDLLDQRDEKLRELSELVSIQVVEQDKGSVNVMIGSGQSLVVGQSVSQFQLHNSGELQLVNKSGSVNVTKAISGGELGGLMRFRDEVLEPSFNQLGRIAVVLAEEFNQIQQQGLDLDGEYGGALFTDVNDPAAMANRIRGHADNAPPDDREVAVEISDTSKLTTENYQLKLIPNTQNYVVTQQSDGKEVTRGVLSGAMPAEISFDGLTVHLQSGSFQGGDEFTIQPTRYGASDIEPLMERPEDLAFASPVRTRTSDGNDGTGVIDSSQVLSLYDDDGDLLPAFANEGQLSPPVVIRFTSPTTYDVLDNSDPANPVHLDPPIRNRSFVPGENNKIFNENPGATLIAGDGAGMGLPEGRIATVQATGGAAAANGYSAEQMRLVTTDPTTGATSNQTVTTQFNASAAETAGLLSNLQGVTANAFTEAVITDTNIASVSAPLQLRVNGEELIPYEFGAPRGDVPNPAVDEGAFNDYIAEQVNANPVLRAQGIYASSVYDPDTGNPELQLLSSSGGNLDIRLEAAAGDNISVNDGVNSNVRLDAAGAGQEALVTVGGRIDLTLDDNVALETAPTVSQFFGDSADPAFAQSAYLGYQTTIKGQPQTDDSFSLEFNQNATMDNRNALRMSAMETDRSIAGGTLSISGAYGQLVEEVASESSLAQINREASKALLEETQSTRDSVSGVNLDEEAANLVKFEQVYNANARVIGIARDIFDTLLGSF